VRCLISSLHLLSSVIVAQIRSSNLNASKKRVVSSMNLMMTIFISLLMMMINLMKNHMVVTTTKLIPTRTKMVTPKSKMVKKKKKLVMRININTSLMRQFKHVLHQIYCMSLIPFPPLCSPFTMSTDFVLIDRLSSSMPQAIICQFFGYLSIYGHKRLASKIDKSNLIVAQFFVSLPPFTP
jgi:hypothetical protein